MSPLRLAWLNLARHRAATLLALCVLSLTVACAGILLRTWLAAESRFATLARTGDAIVGAKADPVGMALNALNLEGPDPGFIPLRLATLINRNWLKKDFTVHVTPLVFCGEYRGRKLIGTSGGLLKQPASGAFQRGQAAPALAEGFWTDKAPGVILGAETARLEGLRIGDTLSFATRPPDSLAAPRPAEESAHGLPARRALQVTGILKPMNNAWDGALFTNIVQAQALLGRLDPAAWNGDWTPLVLHYLVLHVPPGGYDHVHRIINQRTVVQVASIPETLRTLERLTSTGRALGLAIALLALCMAAAAVAALMLGRFEGLSRQMGTLEALGYGRIALGTVLLGEGALLATGSVAFGALADAALFPVFRDMLAGTLPAPDAVSVPLWRSVPVWLVAVPLVTLTAVLSGLLVFRKRVEDRLRETA